MIRGRATIARELAAAERMAAAENLGDELDNDGRVVRTAAERRAGYARRAVRLRGELADLDRILARHGR